MWTLYGIIVKNKISTMNPLLFRNELSLLLEASSNCTNFIVTKISKYRNYNKLTWVSNNDIIMNMIK